VPLLLITIAIIGGTGATASEESAGTLDLLLAQLVTRGPLLLEEAAGLALAILIAALFSLPGFLLGTAFTDVGSSTGRLRAAVLDMLPIAFIFLALSLSAGAALRSRGLAAALATGGVVVSYFVYTVGAAVDALEDVRRLTPFYCYWADGSRVLAHGFD
jgi:ABC-2 type transport system permease protein